MSDRSHKWSKRVEPGRSCSVFPVHCVESPILSLTSGRTPKGTERAGESRTRTSVPRLGSSFRRFAGAASGQLFPAKVDIWPSSVLRGIHGPVTRVSAEIPSVSVCLCTQMKQEMNEIMKWRPLLSLEPRARTSVLQTRRPQQDKLGTSCVVPPVSSLRPSRLLA